MRDLARRRGPVAQEALRALKNPHRYPVALRYLHEWALQVCGCSGFSEVGMNPLSWSTIDAWQRATGHTLTEREVDALFRLDDALRPPVKGD